MEARPTDAGQRDPPRRRPPGGRRCRRRASPSRRSRRATSRRERQLRHTTAEDLRRQRKILGIPIRPGRRGALLALATDLPAPVLAEHFAIHHARAAQWTRWAGRTYADYVAARTVRCR